MNLLLFKLLVVLVNNAKCSFTNIRRLMNNKGEIVNLFRYEASSSEYCPQNFCKNAICVDYRCCECRCRGGDFFMSLADGCLNQRTWNDAKIRFDNELVPLVKSPVDLQHKKIRVPGTQLNTKCRIGSIFYFDSNIGVKHLLIQNPTKKFVALGIAVSGYALILVSDFPFFKT